MAKKGNSKSLVVQFQDAVATFIAADNSSTGSRTAPDIDKLQQLTEYASRLQQFIKENYAGNPDLVAFASEEQCKAGIKQAQVEFDKLFSAAVADFIKSIGDFGKYIAKPDTLLPDFMEYLRVDNPRVNRMVTDETCAAHFSKYNIRLAVDTEPDEPLDARKRYDRGRKLYPQFEKEVPSTSTVPLSTVDKIKAFKLYININFSHSLPGFSHLEASNVVNGVTPPKRSGNNWKQTVTGLFKAKEQEGAEPTQTWGTTEWNPTKDHADSKKEESTEKVPGWVFAVIGATLFSSVVGIFAYSAGFNARRSAWDDPSDDPGARTEDRHASENPPAILQTEIYRLEAAHTLADIVCVANVDNPLSPTQRAKAIEQVVELARWSFPLSRPSDSEGRPSPTITQGADNPNIVIVDIPAPFYIRAEAGYNPKGFVKEIFKEFIVPDPLKTYAQPKEPYGSIIVLNTGLPGFDRALARFANAQLQDEPHNNLPRRSGAR